MAMKFSYLKKVLQAEHSYLYEMEDWNAPRARVYIEASLGVLIEKNAQLAHELATEREINARVNQILSGCSKR